MERRARAQTRTKEKFVCDSTGRRRAVVLHLKVYNEMLEDLDDLRLLAERRNEPTISLEEVEKRLKERLDDKQKLVTLVGIRHRKDAYRK